MHPESLRLARHWLVTGLEKGRDFFILRRDIDWLNGLTPSHFESLALRLRSTEPDPVTFANVPKDDGVFRNVPVPSVRDRLLLTALVIDEYHTMRGNVPSMKVRDINYQYPLPDDPQDTNWINEWKKPYHSFRDRMRSLENEGYLVLNTDIRNFSGMVRIDQLIGALKGAGWKQDNIDLCSRFLERWKQQGMRGIPQGMVVTEHFLSVYLSPLDISMTSYPGIEYFRYCDDIRIASKDERGLYDARSRLEMELSQLGLQTKPSKTFISGKAHNVLAYRIEDIYDPLLKEQGLPDIGAMSEDVAVPREVLEQVYQTHISPRRADRALPNQTLVNFTINRLGRSGSCVAQPDLAYLLKEHPGKVNILIRYALNTGYVDYPGLLKAIDDPLQRSYAAYALMSCSVESVARHGIVSPSVLAYADTILKGGFGLHASEKAAEFLAAARKQGYSPEFPVDVSLPVGLAP